MNLTDLIPGADLVKVGMSILDKVIPDPAQKAQAQLALVNAERQGQLDETKTTLSAIIAEASSPDPWTSRARPSFMYVFYILVLFALPMGLLAAFSPEKAGAIATGMQAWLRAIPDILYQVFVAGYLGYVGGRTYEKVKGAAQ